MLNTASASASQLQVNERRIIMKRKLNENDVPEEVVRVSPPPADPSFDALGLDARLLQAIAMEKYSIPTPVQAKAIPLALQGRDVLGKEIIS